MLLQKVVYHKKTWIIGKKLNDTLLSVKENFYSHLNKEDITDVHYTYGKRVCKDFEIKKLGKYHDLHAQGNTLSLIYKT